MAEENREISSRPGDDGWSDTLGGPRRSKSDPVFEALGDLDELNSYLGVVRHAALAHGTTARELIEVLEAVQSAVMAIASVIAAEPAGRSASTVPGVTSGQIARLELEESRMREITEIGERFSVPGKHGGIPELDVARSLARRCERRVVAVLGGRASGDGKLALGQRYLNRLADYLFVAARRYEQLTP